MTAMTTGRRAVRLAPLLLGSALVALASLPASAITLPPILPADVPGGGSGGVVLAQSSAETAQQSMRIDRLEDQMRQLNGRIDEMTYSLQQIRRC